MNIHYKDDCITLHKIKCGPYDNNAYLVVCPKTNESIIIDTPPEPSQLILAAKTTNVKVILITHNHPDHIQGLDEVTSVIKAPVSIGKADSHVLNDSIDFSIEDGQEVKAGTITLKAISTPGHTVGSTCFKFRKHLFTGDTLFPGGPGKTESPETFKQIIKSITRKLFTLDDKIAIYPGHGDDSDLKTAKQEHKIFMSKEHRGDLYGDVLWSKD